MQGSGGDGLLTAQERFCKVWRERGRKVLEQVMAKPAYKLTAKAIQAMSIEELLERKWRTDYPRRPWDEVTGARR